MVQSTTVDTYVNVMSAICEEYSVEHIMLSFVDSDPDENFVSNIQKRLVSLLSNSRYAKATRVKLEIERASENYVSVVEGWDVVDVTAVSKELAINFSAAAIGIRRVHVCQLNWLKRFKKDEDWILVDGNHRYSDLMSSGALSSLYKEHFHKRHVIIAFGILFSVFLVVSVSKIFIPSFVVPEDLVNLFSLMIGAAGLYLAIISLRVKNI
ncbi:hypothetical protein Dbac_1651 [Desulfomicrobium baculatum DSM 4028]|uniref:Uncharacterized protein n=2 Tax=Desulfomicrobium baculatum TaxID=899 RepID=C7LVI7_DESBD|nr:hypothetical protein Dbac_1651 [Desulfomicrobium baculatum DSM 4028]